MAALYGLDETSVTQNPRLKSIRLIELSDHIMRLNRRENIQLDLRLQQMARRERIIQMNYDREIYWRRLQLAQIHKALEQSSDYTSQRSRTQTPVSFYAIKTRRHQSAPSNRSREAIENRAHARPNTTSNVFRSNKRAMSVFREITLKPEHKNIDNMLVLADDGKHRYQKRWASRSKTMVSLRQDD